MSTTEPPETTPAAIQAAAKAHITRRRAARRSLSVPVHVTILRSGIPFSIPGRSLNLSEVGLGAVLAGELRPNDSVGVEFQLPDSDEPLYIKAVLRSQNLLCAGLEFLGLSPEQRAAIRQWAGKAAASASENKAAVSAVLDSWSLEPKAKPTAPPRRPMATPAGKKRNAVAVRIGLIMAAAILAAFGWWRWSRGWTELESQASTGKPQVIEVPTNVPGDEMAKLVLYRSDPVYPDEARRANVQGVVMLDAIIGRDGTVQELHRISGPDELTSAAEDAVKLWRFEPYRINGQPVEVETTLALDVKPN